MRGGRAVESEACSVAVLGGCGLVGSVEREVGRRRIGKGSGGRRGKGGRRDEEEMGGRGEDEQGYLGV